MTAANPPVRRRVPAAPVVSHEAGYAGLDLLPSAVLLADQNFRIVHANSAAENLFELSLKNLCGRRVEQLLQGETLAQLLVEVVEQEWSHRTCEIEVAPPGREPVLVACVVTPAHRAPVRVLLELHVIDQPLRLAREERVQEQSEANRQLIRNLAHEIKNPLGGIRGAAQLLAMEVGHPQSRGDDGTSGKAIGLSPRELTEYTQVIIHEADRLQALVDRLLAPHRRPHVVSDVNIHEVCERVRSLILAEFPRGLTVQHDYDTSIPDLRGDREQLIQAVLNIAHNAAHALAERIAAGDARIVLRTRVARQVTIGKQRFRLALELHIEDNGPGVPDDIRDRIFYPLVSGREGGSGLGLTLAQTFVQQHQGMIECESSPGHTSFTILMPLH